MIDSPVKLLAISSGGGHWTQLMRLRQAFDKCDVVYVSTLPKSLSPDGSIIYSVPDANRWDKIALVRMAWSVLIVLLKERPDVVVTTGAAPGYIAIRLGRLLGAKTIWIDSLANVDELSMAGRMAGPYADLWLTQWKHLAKPDGPDFAGAVI